MFSAALRWHAPAIRVRVSWLAALCLVGAALTHAHADAPRLWTTGGAGPDAVHAVAVDKAGFVYATGAFSGTVDFDPGAGTHALTVPSGNATDIWVTKMDGEGNLAWVRVMSGPGPDAGHAIAVDGQGNVLVVGRYAGGIDANPGSGVHSLPGNGVFLAKLSESGDFLWARPLAVNSVSGIVVDAAGAIYLTGWFTGVSSYSAADASYTLTSNGSLDVFVKKVSPDGKVLWVRSFGGSGMDHADSLAISATGMVVVSGHFHGTVDFNPGTQPAVLSSAGRRGLFVTAFGPDGALGWVSAFDETTGAVSGTITRGDFGPAARAHALTAGGRLVTTLNGRGEAMATHAAGAVSELVAVDAHGALYTAGHAAGGAFVHAAGAADGWSWQFVPMGAAAADTRIRSLAVDAGGGVIAAGAFRDSVDFGPGVKERVRTSSGHRDIFMARLVRYGSWSPIDPNLDSDGDGMTDAFELEHGFNPFDPSDGGTVDTDGNGLTNTEESALADRFPVDPRNALLPRREWHVSAVHGDDTRSALEGGGTPEHPWRTIGTATAILGELARPHFPVQIVLDEAPNAQHGTLGAVAVYEEWVTLPAHVTLRAHNHAAGGRVLIRAPGAAGIPVVRGGSGSQLRHVRVMPAQGGHAGVLLLEAAGVSMTLHDVILDGEGNPGSTGLRVSGADSSGTRVEGCVFTGLGTGILALHSGLMVRDSQFERIAANGADSRAIAIGQAGIVPDLGSVDALRESGFNRFRDLAPGAKAIAMLDAAALPVQAKYNDWGVYTAVAIAALIDMPVAVATEPFLPADQTLLEGALTGVVLDAATMRPIPPRRWPSVQLNGTGLSAAPDEAHGVFVFPAVGAGPHTLTAGAVGYAEATIVAPVASDTRVPAAPRILLHRLDGAAGWLVDVNGDGRVNAADVQLVINGALGMALNQAVIADVNGDGVINAVDVQLVINAALGM